MEGIRIRPADLSDLRHILRHRCAMFHEMGEWDSTLLERVEPLSEVYLRDALHNGGYRGWVAETERGQVVAGGGIVIASWPGHPGESMPRKAWILNMYTEPNFRRRGIAKQIMEVMIGWCRSEGFSAVSLHASNDGRPLYERLGFKATNEMRLVL